MYFLIEANDREGVLEQRLELRERHIAYWRGFGTKVAAGGALLAHDGPDATARGSMLVVEAADLTEAKAMLAGDPFTIEGVFSDDISLRPWRPGLGRWCEQ